MILNCHHSLLSFILANLGFSTSAKDWSPNTVVVGGHVQVWATHRVLLGDLQAPGRSGGLTLNR